MAATRSGSVQDVVERDARLVELVHLVLPFTGARIHVADAVSFVAGADGGGYDLVVGDVFRGAVASVCLIGSPKMLRSRRYGNVILVGSDGEMPTRLLTAAAARDPAGGRVLSGPGLTAFLGTT